MSDVHGVRKLLLNVGDGIASFCRIARTQVYAGWTMVRELKNCFFSKANVPYQRDTESANHVNRIKPLKGHNLAPLKLTSSNKDHLAGEIGDITSRLK